MYQKLEDEDGHLVLFESVKSIAVNVCPINSFGNKLPTANMIASVAKQGPIYVRATKKRKLPVDDENTKDEDDDADDEDELEVRTSTLYKLSNT